MSNQPKLKQWKKLSREALLASVWFWPLVWVVTSLVIAMVLGLIRPEPGTVWARRLWPGGLDIASTMLQVIGSSIMTAATVTFSLTVVALQLASQPFSPRLLREFAGDRLIQAVLALLVSTFVVSLWGLRSLDLVNGPVRRFGRSEPLVLTALLRMLRDCAANVRDSDQAEAVALQAQLVLSEMSDDLQDYDQAAVRGLAERVQQVLRGDLAQAYSDRAGETRST